MKKKNLGFFLSLALLIYMAVSSEKMILVAEGYAVSYEVIEAGRVVYFDHCHHCHDGRLSSAPRIGNGQEWEERIDRGVPSLIVHATSEHRHRHFLPPPGASEPDDEKIASAVAYLILESGKLR